MPANGIDYSCFACPTTDCGEVEANLATCVIDKNALQASLNTATQNLTACTTSKGQLEADLVLAAQNLSVCTALKEQAENDLATCVIDKNALQASLNTATQNLATCVSEKEAIQESLNASLLDIINLKEQINTLEGQLSVALDSNLKLIELLDKCDSGTLELSLPPFLNLEGEAGDRFVGIFNCVENSVDTVAIKFRADYTVTWGDGTVEEYLSGTIAEHTYDFATMPSSSLVDGAKQTMVIVTPKTGQRFTFMSLSLTLESGRRNPAFTRLQLEGDAIVTLEQSFIYCAEIKEIALSNMTSLISLNSAFKYCANLISFKLLSNSPALTTAYYAFGGCPVLKNVLMPDCPALEYIRYMLLSAYSIIELDLGNSPIRDAYRALDASRLLSKLNLNTSLAINLELMLRNTHTLSTVSLNLLSATNAISVLDNASMLKIANITNASTSFAITNSRLPVEQLEILFNNLVDQSGQTQQVLILTGTLGVADLTPGIEAIATSKNWALVL